MLKAFVSLSLDRLWYWPSVLGMWLVILTPGIWATNAAALEPCNLDEEFPTTRPIPPEGGPTNIHVKFFLFDLVEIVTVKQEFTLDLFVNVQWKDPRVGASLRKAGAKRCEIPFSVSRFLAQYFVNYNLPDGWYLTSAPIITANWEAEGKGNKWTVPIGGGFGKVFRIGKLPFNGNVGAFTNVVRPNGAADWTLRLQLALLLPKSMFSD